MQQKSQNPYLCYLQNNYIKYYDVISTHWYLSSQEECYYSDDDYPVFKVTDFTYDPINYLPQTSITKNSIADVAQTLEIRNKYISSAVVGAELDMKTNHMVNLPTETYQLIDNKVVAGKKYTYVETLGMHLMKEMQTLKLANPVAYNNYFHYYEKDFEFVKYNSKGRPVEVRNKENLNIVYLWGYKGEYVVAEIVNATYYEIKNILGEQFIENLEKTNVITESDIEKINQLRESYSVTSFTYHPLIGVHSITDPRGRAEYYIYSNYGQLIEKYMKEENGDENTLERYEYHYEN